MPCGHFNPKVVFPFNLFLYRLNRMLLEMCSSQAPTLSFFFLLFLNKVIAGRNTVHAAYLVQADWLLF